jgi:2-polyprenyl-3-methyl-5-hydroxy-6-metoxy-1,4-benzoquinol methylase
MFGEKLDYLILRRFAHKRNLATEEDLNIRGRDPLGSAEEANPKLQKHIGFFEGKIPISPNLRYLDMGCGKGELTILLGKMGCGHITGIDIVPRSIWGSHERILSSTNTLEGGLVFREGHTPDS